jgi:hypothetical protein
MFPKTRKGDDPLPEGLDQLDRLLRRVRFQPRASLGPELLGRLRRGEEPAISDRISVGWAWTGPLLAGFAALLALTLLGPNGRITVDRCCFDLDGGGTADDGARIVGGRNGRPSRISVYEDRDGSRDLTPADIVRFDRTGTPRLEQLGLPGKTKIQHCCQDLDGEGPADDGIFVLATPPDRVHTAAIYQLR